MQQSFLRMEIKSFQKNSFCTRDKIIQFLKTTINLEKYENPIFSILYQVHRTCLVYTNGCFYLFSLNRSNNNNPIMILGGCLWLCNCLNGLLLKPGPRPWNRILDPDPKKPGPLRMWTLKILDYEKRGKQVDAAEKIRRPHGIIC